MELNSSWHQSTKRQISRSLFESQCEKRTFWHVCPTKTQSRLCIRCLVRVFVVFIYSLAIRNALESEDSDQIAQMRRLICIFTSPHVWKCLFCHCGSSCESKGEFRMIFEGGSILSIYRTYSTYSERQAWGNSVDPGLHCLPFVKQFYTHSLVAKRTCWGKI